MEVREAYEDELVAVSSILNGALLTVTPDAVRTGETLVAVVEGRILGALVLADRWVVGVAVRPRSRGGGVGTALVEAAAARREWLVAEFDAGVRPFYESLGFTIEPTDQVGRFRGVRGR